MCILFFYAARPPPSGQKIVKNLKRFILAANRDEIYSRPSKTAHFWPSDPNILAGTDQESGGTWLGINKKTGRIAAVTNIMGGTSRDPKNPKLSRGSVISTFLRSDSAMNGPLYCRSLYQDVDIVEKFNKFNLLTVDLFAKSTGVTYLTNASRTEPVSFGPTDSDLYLGVSNSVWQRPFKKVIAGTQVFKEIIDSHHENPGSNDQLVEQLLQFLKDRRQYWPDVQIESQVKGEYRAAARYLSSIFVDAPSVNYGTRTHTIISVDYQNNVDFHEWTLENYISSTPTTADNTTTEAQYPTWHHSHFNFSVQPTTTTSVPNNVIEFRSS